MISSAFAQSAAGGAGGFSIQGLLPFVLIFIIFYFLLIRPQQKRVKQHKLMVENLKRGNKVLTAGGIFGVISKANDGAETVTVEISQGVLVDVARQMISEVRGEEKLKSKPDKATAKKVAPPKAKSKR
jgi:preprotein translocase subunit YajC